MTFDPTEELRNKKAHAIIKDVLSRGGRIIIPGHVKKRMQERGYRMQDVEFILLHGTITGKEFKKDCQHWRYTISGVDLDGDSGAAVTAILQRNAIALITVLS